MSDALIVVSFLVWLIGALISTYALVGMRMKGETFTATGAILLIVFWLPCLLFAVASLVVVSVAYAITGNERLARLLRHEPQAKAVTHE